MAVVCRFKKAVTICSLYGKIESVDLIANNKAHVVIDGYHDSAAWSDVVNVWIAGLAVSIQHRL